MAPERNAESPRLVRVVVVAAAPVHARGAVRARGGRDGGVGGVELNRADGSRVALQRAARAERARRRDHRRAERLGVARVGAASRQELHQPEVPVSRGGEYRGLFSTLFGRPCTRRRCRETRVAGPDPVGVDPRREQRLRRRRRARRRRHRQGRAPPRVQQVGVAHGRAEHPNHLRPVKRGGDVQQRGFVRVEPFVDGRARVKQRGDGLDLALGARRVQSRLPVRVRRVHETPRSRLGDVCVRRGARFLRVRFAFDAREARPRSARCLPDDPQGLHERTHRATRRLRERLEAVAAVFLFSPLEVSRGFLRTGRAAEFQSRPVARGALGVLVRLHLRQRRGQRAHRLRVPPGRGVVQRGGAARVAGPGVHRARLKHQRDHLGAPPRGGAHQRGHLRRRPPRGARSEQRRDARELSQRARQLKRRRADGGAGGRMLLWRPRVRFGIPSRRLRPERVRRGAPRDGGVRGGRERAGRARRGRVRVCALVDEQPQQIGARVAHGD